MSAPDLAIIIVTWNVRQLVINALHSLESDLRASGLASAICVVDNASADGTAEAIRSQFPAVRLIARSDNLGFAGGNNFAMRELGFCDQPGLNPQGPRAVFLLNPDTLVEPGAIRALYDALFNLSKAGLVGAQLKYEDGSFQHGAFQFPGLAQIIIDLFPLPDRLYGKLYESRLNGRYPRQLYAENNPFQVDHTLGATMMLRREVIEQVGLFDPQFYMYCEEIDWCMRIHQAGWEIYTVPAAHIVHLAGKSSGQVRPESLYNLWLSRYRLYQKHYSAAKLFVACQLVQLGMRLQIGRARSSIMRGEMPVSEGTVLIEAYQKIIDLFGAQSK